MTNFSLEYFMGLKSSWEFLKKTKLPIFIYGMGDGAVKILAQFSRHKIPYCGFFASDEFVRGHSFFGHRVHSISEIEEKVSEFVIVLAFAAGYDTLINKIQSISNKHIVIAPDVPVCGDGLFTKEYLSHNFQSFQRVYELLSDEKSKEVLKKIIEYKITGKIQPLIEASSTPKEAQEEILKLSKDEVYIDAGAYDGDTVNQFIDFTGGEYKKIIAVEPDRKNFKKLNKSVADKDNIDTINAAVWSEDKLLNFSDSAGRQSFVSDSGKEIQGRAIDSILNGGAATYIKYDVEGAEKEALLGSHETIQKYSPKLSVALYHRNEDIFELPLLINKLNTSYKLFMRKYPYIPAWEINLFCTPE